MQELSQHESAAVSPFSEWHKTHLSHGVLGTRAKLRVELGQVKTTPS